MKTTLVILILLQWSTAALTELNVNIAVDYTPPPDFSPGLNEYRAASGPVNVTCTIQADLGGDDNASYTYMWLSTCKNCPFSGSELPSVVRDAVHSGDNGTHTCVATQTGTGITGNASIDFIIVGAGIYVFNGVPNGSLPNNGIVTSELIHHLRFVCHSDSMIKIIGKFIGLNGEEITNNSHFRVVSSTLPGQLLVENGTDVLTESEQGVYTCSIPLSDNSTREINIGIYPTGFKAAPSITSLVFTRGFSSSTLTCTSTGSPATNITWTRDGQPLTINGNMYRLTQTVTNRTGSTYDNVLTINDELLDVVNFTYGCNVRNILGVDDYSLTELFVAISVSYDPPPDVVLGPNEYRAASGPVIVICIVIGGTAKIDYQWESTCRNCPFKTATSKMITRGAVASGDNGTHTCTVEGIGSASINFIVKGAGIHIFRGIPPGSLTNNSLVTLVSDTMETNFRLRFVCRSDSMLPSVGMLIGLDGKPIATHNSSVFGISNSQPGELNVANIVANSNDLTVSGQGVYTCLIPLQSEETREISIGIYPSGFKTSPQITNLTFTDGSSSSFLTCTSTGSPATTVTWMRDGQPLTINGSTYKLTQTVANRAESSYKNVLIVKEELSAVIGHYYTCIVSNINGNASEHLNLTALCPGMADIEHGMVNLTGNSIGDTAAYTCNSGFELIGDETTTCRLVDTDSAAFQPAPPSCRPLCPGMVDINNGMVTFTGNSIGDTAIYTCDMGFELIGSVTTTCTRVDVNSASFQPAPPSCRPLCPHLVDINDGMVTFTGNSIGDTATYTCDLGFELIGSVTTTCSLVNANTAAFLPPSPSCRPLCPDPIDIDNGMVTFTGNSIGDTATYTCDMGFELIGRATAICTLENVNSASFQPAPPSCRPLCPRLVDINNGMVTFTGNSIGDTAIYTCDMGFELIGSATTICTLKNANTAAFLLPSPSCRPLCSHLVDINNGMVTFTGNSIGDTATYTCDMGFELMGSVTTTCTRVDVNSAVFQPAPPSCRPLCPDLIDIDNGIVTFTGNSIGDTATYTCDLGLGLIGNATTICTRVDANSASFQPAPPSCKPLSVTISVSYDHPPDIVLGPNEYRAASGPVNVTCTAEGATGTVSYKWSSTCRDCIFQTSTKDKVVRTAVYSGDTGNHTCTATDRNGISGSNSVEFNVVGAGIYIFQGIPRGSLPNNGLVSFLDRPSKNTGLYLRLFCRSGSMTGNVGNLTGLDRTTVNSGNLFNISRPQPGELRVESNQSALMADQQGVYTCHIPLASGTETKEINIGIYSHGFNTTPQITNLVLSPGSSSSNVSCISTGSPPTTVTWRLRNGDYLTMRNGDVMCSIATGITYQMTQIITDRRSSTYENILTILETFVSIESFQGHECTVNNTLGSSKPVSLEVNVTILPVESAMIMFGENYTLTCRVSGVSGAGITYQWSSPGMVVIKTVPQLKFTSIRFSDVGMYKCTATIGPSTISTSRDVFVLIPKPKVQIHGAEEVNAGRMLNLTCVIRPEDSMMVVVSSTWSKDSKEIKNNERFTVSTVHQINETTYASSIMFKLITANDTGRYNCQAIVYSDTTSQYIINGTGSAVKYITVSDPPLLVSLNSSTTMDLPNIPPYNIFFLNCTATVPQEVVTPKTFSWKRRTGHSLEEVRNDSSTVIRFENSNQDQPVSTSVLTATETAPGIYHFECQVELDELGVRDTSNEYSISITRFSLSANITGETIPLAAEKYTLTCIVTVTAGVPDNLTAHWSGPGVGMDGVTATDISTETQADGSTFTFNLTFNPLRQSHEGNYSCTARLAAVNITHSSHTAISTAISSCTAEETVITLREDERITNSLYWPEAQIGQTVSVNCTCGNVTIARASRFCGGDIATGATWKNPDYSACSFTTTVGDICQLVTAEQEADTGDTLVALEKLTGENKEIGVAEISITTFILENLSSNITQDQNRTMIESFFTVVDNLLAVDPSEFQDSQQEFNTSARLLEATQTVTDALLIPENESHAVIALTFFAVAVQEIQGDDLQPQTFSALFGRTSDEAINSKELFFDVHQNSTASVTLPASALVEPLPANVSTNTTIRITNSVYVNDLLFLRRGEESLQVGSIIISASVSSNNRSENLDPPVHLTFMKNPTVENGTNTTCSFWDSTADNGFGDWSTRGCAIVTETEESVVCECDHLTNFAILLDVSPKANGTSASVGITKTLEALSYIGAIISICFLTLTIATYLSSKKLRSSEPSQLLVNLCFGFLGIYVVYIFALHATSVSGLCVLAGVLVHYFLLATFFIMAADAILIFNKLIFVFVKIRRYVAIASIVSWSVPAIIAIATVVPDYKNYLEINFCRPYGVQFYAGLLAPFLAIYIFNWIVYVIIMVFLINHYFCKSKDTVKKPHQGSQVRQQFRNAITLSLLFGLGWAFGLPATEGIDSVSVRTAFQVLFIIVTAFQGLYIFIMQCLTGSNAVEAMKEWQRWFYSITCRPSHVHAYTLSRTPASASERISRKVETITLTSSKDLPSVTADKLQYATELEMDTKVKNGEDTDSISESAQ